MTLWLGSGQGYDEDYDDDRRPFRLKSNWFKRNFALPLLQAGVAMVDPAPIGHAWGRGVARRFTLESGLGDEDMAARLMPVPDELARGSCSLPWN